MRIFLILIILLSYASLVLAAEKEEATISDRIYTPIEKYDVGFYVTEIGGQNQIHVRNVMTIKAFNVPNYFKTSFFLNKSFEVEKILVNGYPVEIVILQRFSSNYFDKELSIEQLETIVQICNYYEVEVPILSETQEEVKIEFQYSLITTTSNEVVTISEDTFSFNGTAYWYPIYLPSLPSEFSIVVNSLENISSNVGNIQSDVKVKNQIKQTKFQIIELQKPVDLTIKRS